MPRRLAGLNRGMVEDCVVLEQAANLAQIAGLRRGRSLSRASIGQPPLSRTQERALFRRLRLPDTPARERAQLRQRLVGGTLQVVFQCLRGIGPRGQLAELLQEGVLALAHAVDTFARRDRRNDFRRFAMMSITRWLRRTVRAWARERRLLVNRALETLIDEQLSDPFSAASQTELEQKIAHMVSLLPEVQQRVLRLRFGIGAPEAQSREAIGKELCLDEQRVRYLEERALLALRRRAERDWPRGTRLSDIRA